MKGKLATVGEAKKRLRRYARVIQNLGWRVTLSKINILTISASFKLRQTLDLGKVVRFYNGNYEPELFPAAMFTVERVHFTCFHSGTVLMTGIKCHRQLHEICMPVLIELQLL